MRILVVDDEPAVAYLLADAIRADGGHEVTIATSGKEALALLEHHTPDAVFLDVSMPEMSGVEVLRQVRARHRLLPVLLITGYAQHEDLETARSLGVSDIIEKPTVLKGVSDAIKVLVRD